MLRNVLIRAVSLLLLVSAPAAAQTVRTGGVEGAVKDATGAALPGVNVTLTSTALQVPQLVTVTEDGGEYRFAGLPQGTYQVTFDLSGFTKLRRQDIILTAGFVARVDAVLTIGAVEASV